METQERLKPSGNGRTHPFARGMRDLVHDVLTLAELQGELAVADAKESKARLIRAGMLVTSAIVLALAALPVMILGLANWLATTLGWDAYLGQLLIGGVVIATAAGLGAFGWKTLARSCGSFKRSRAEFGENFRWFKSVLRSPRDPHREATSATMAGERF